MVERLELDGSSLTAAQLVAASGGPVEVVVGGAARDRVERAWRGVTEVVSRRAVYGRTTGVGANRSTVVDPGTAADVRMLRSHGTGSGPVLGDEVVRAAMVVRLNQVLRGGSGLHPAIVDALVAALACDSVPVIHAQGAIGTGDLSTLGELALALMGELGFSDGTRRELWQPHTGDALAIISSNAFTAAQACLALGRARQLLDDQFLVAALSHVAMRGSREALADTVARARPHRQVAAASARMRELLSGADQEAARIQDSYGLRAFPQVTAAWADSLDRLEEVLAVEVNSAPENPLVSADEQDVFHHGNFHGAALGQALDAAKVALYSAAALSLSRMTALSSPGVTGLPAFLADGPAGSSGVMLLEYNQAAALAALRHAAAPATLGSVVISLGVEDHSSFATQAADQLQECLGLATTGLACELLAAARAVTMTHAGLDPASELAGFLARVQDCTSPELGDRSLTEDLAAVAALLSTPRKNRT